MSPKSPYVEEDGRGQNARVHLILLDGLWHTPRELKEKCMGSEDSITARIRDLRKPSFGSYRIEKRRTKDRKAMGLWEYRMVPPKEKKK